MSKKYPISVTLSGDEVSEVLVRHVMSRLGLSRVKGFNLTIERARVEGGFEVVVELGPNG